MGLHSRKERAEAARTSSTPDSAHVAQGITTVNILRSRPVILGFRPLQNLPDPLVDYGDVRQIIFRLPLAAPTPSFIEKAISSTHLHHRHDQSCGFSKPTTETMLRDVARHNGLRHVTRCRCSTYGAPHVLEDAIESPQAPRL